MLAIFRCVLGDQYALGVERNCEEMAHVEQDRNSLLVRRVIEVEADVLSLHGIVKAGTDPVTGENLTDNFLLVGVKMEALDARVGQKSDRPRNGWAVMYPRLDLWMKYLRERARVNALAPDAVFWIEEACLGQEGLGLFILSEKSRLARLLDQLGDVPLMGNGVRPGVVAVVRIELDRFVELNLSAGEVVVLEQAGSRQIRVFGRLDLMFCRHADGGFYRFIDRGRLVSGDRSLGSCGEAGSAKCERERASCECGGALLEEGSHRLPVRRSRQLTGAGNALNS